MPVRRGETVKVDVTDLQLLSLFEGERRASEISCLLLRIDGGVFPGKMLVGSEVFQHQAEENFGGGRKRRRPGDRTVATTLALVAAGNQVLLAGDYVQLAGMLFFGRAAVYARVRENIVLTAKKNRRRV